MLVGYSSQQHLPFKQDIIIYIVTCNEITLAILTASTVCRVHSAAKNAITNIPLTRLPGDTTIHVNSSCSVSVTVSALYPNNLIQSKTNADTSNSKS